MSAASTDDGEKVKKVLPPPAPAGRSSSGPYVFLRQRSLATRVIALTTVAVGLSVTVVALAAFFTVRAQTMSTLRFMAAKVLRRPVACDRDRRDYPVPTWQPSRCAVDRARPGRVRSPACVA